MDLGLRDRVYLITGGSAGLGLATAEVLVGEGACVVVSGRSESALDAAVDRLGSERATGVSCDNADTETPDRLIHTALTRFERLDGLLVSVGGPPSGAVTTVSDEQWRWSFESVFLGAVRLVRSVAPRLGEGGSIAFVLSTSVRVPIAELGISNGLRPGLAMVAKSLANELGPAGVRVNGLMPGWTATGRLQYLKSQSSPASLQEDVASIPLGRPGDPAEFARVAAFILSPAASYITGAMIPVDGGALPGI
jgi:3-oxoacyl-[acyl-carrier protein] reductase